MEQKTPLNCIVDPNSNCDECELNNKLICNFDPRFPKKFGIGNLLYRIFALGLLALVALLEGHWWFFTVYAITIFLNFSIIEPYLLCAHCPFYAIQGKFLKCWGLRGMPKLRKYNPAPMKPWEKITMLIIGTFIDLFPFAILVYGIIWKIINFSGQIELFIGLLVIGAIFIGLMVWLNNLLQGDTCKRCPNFSCPMSKTPKNLIEKFLTLNPVMKEAWIKSGWKPKKKLS
ncbi:MAG: hypothetical protein ACTSVU_02280 [Promethearchaeota archaeon]